MNCMCHICFSSNFFKRNKVGCNISLGCCLWWCCMVCIPDVLVEVSHRSTELLHWYFKSLQTELALEFWMSSHREGNHVDINWSSKKVLEMWPCCFTNLQEIRQKDNAKRLHSNSWCLPFSTCPFESFECTQLTFQMLSAWNLISSASHEIHLHILSGILRIWGGSSRSIIGKLRWSNGYFRVTCHLSPCSMHANLQRSVMCLFAQWSWSKFIWVRSTRAVAKDSNCIPCPKTAGKEWFLRKERNRIWPLKPWNRGSFGSPWGEVYWCGHC